MTNIRFNRGAISAGDCINSGWELVKQNYWMYLGMVVLAVVLAGCIPCVSLFLMGPVMAGVYYVLLRQMRGERVEFGMMFRGFDTFVPLMVIGIIQSIPEIVGQGIRIGVDVGRIAASRGGSGRSGEFFQAGPDFAIASGLTLLVVLIALGFFLFALVWRLLLFFALPLAIEHGLGAVDAMKLSVSAALANIGGLILLFILEFFVALLGILMLCIGVFFVMPIIFAANAFAYRYVFPDVGGSVSPAAPPGFAGAPGEY